VANERTANRWLVERSSSGHGVAEYCRYNEQLTQRTTSFDVIDFPDVTVSEGEADDDLLLELDLMRWDAPWEVK
jgi:hypothetical protein